LFLLVLFYFLFLGIAWHAVILQTIFADRRYQGQRGGYKATGQQRRGVASDKR